MKETLELLIRCAESEIVIANSIVDDSLRRVKSVTHLPEGDPAYDALVKYGHTEQFCQGRISAFKEVIAILGGKNEYIP